MRSIVLKMVALACVSIALQSCTNSADRYSAVAGPYNISWSLFNPNLDIYSDLLNQRDGAEIYLFARWVDTGITSSNGRPIQSFSDCAVISTDTSLPNNHDVQSYEQCVASLDAAKKKAPNLKLKEFVGLAKTAVEKDGRCEWVGYDPALDMRVRRTGSLASTKDEGLFFAPLRCAP